jgi:hypothetical protein
MMDSVKTIVAGVGGVSIWLVDWFAPLIQALISIATLIYVLAKIKNEVKK